MAGNTRGYDRVEKTRHDKRLRSHLYGLLLGLVATIALCIGGVFVYTSQKAIARLGEDLVVQTEDKVRLQLQSYLDTAIQINAINSQLYSQGLIKLDDHKSWALQLDAQVKQFRNISFIAMAAADGTWFGLNNSDHRRYEHADGKRLIEYEWIDGGEIGPRISVKENYSALGREWFEGPFAQQRQVWSPIYNWAEQPQLAMSLGLPLFNNEGAPEALFTVDLSLGHISDFLSHFTIGQSGKIFIIRRNGMLVASSGEYPPYDFGKGGNFEQIMATDYRDNLIAGVSQHLLNEIPLASLQEARGYKLDIDGEVTNTYISPFHTDNKIDWLIVVTVPESELMAGVYQGIRWSVLVGISIALIALFIGALLANRLSQPLGQLAKQVAEIRWLHLDQNFSIGSSVAEVREMASALDHMQAGLQSFAKFVPQQVVKQILSEGQVAQLGGEKRDVTVLFSDVHGYSTISENLDPSMVVSLLNDYFTAMQQVIADHGGTVIELIGDGILAVFGAPEPSEKHTQNAVLCAEAMQDALDRLNREWQESGEDRAWQEHGLEHFEHRVGIHCGSVIVGNIGGEQYIKYGVIGDVVNIASRLEALNKDYDTHIMLSEQVYGLLTEKLRKDFEYKDEVVLKGRTQHLRVYAK